MAGQHSLVLDFKQRGQRISWWFTRTILYSGPRRHDGGREGGFGSGGIDNDALVLCSYRASLYTMTVSV